MDKHQYWGVRVAEYHLLYCTAYLYVSQSRFNYFDFSVTLFHYYIFVGTASVIRRKVIFILLRAKAAKCEY